MKRQEQDLYIALDETLEDMAEAIQYEASIDDRGYSPPGYESAMPLDEARANAALDLKDALTAGDHNRFQASTVDELIEGNNLPPEARGYSATKIKKLITELTKPTNLRGARQVITLRGPATPNDVRAAVCDALMEVGQLGLNFDDYLIDDPALACEAYTRIVTPADPSVWDEPVELHPTRAPIVIEVYHEHTGRPGTGEPPDDPYASEHANRDWNAANTILEAQGWDIGWDSKNAAVAYFAYWGPTGTEEAYWKAARARNDRKVAEDPFEY